MAAVAKPCNDLEDYDRVIALFHFATDIKRSLLEYYLSKNALNLIDLFKTKKEEILSYEDVRQALRKTSIVLPNDLSLNTLNYILKTHCYALYWSSCLDDVKLTFEEFLNLHRSKIYKLTQCIMQYSSSSYLSQNSVLLSKKDFELLFVTDFDSSHLEIEHSDDHADKLLAKPGIQLFSLSSDLQIILLNALCPLRQAVNNVTEVQRNICKTVVLKENIDHEIWSSMEKYTSMIVKEDNKSVIIKVKSIRSSYLGKKQCLQNRRRILDDALNDVSFVDDLEFCQRVRRQLNDLSLQDVLNLCGRDISVVLQQGQYRNGMYPEAVFKSADQDLECFTAAYGSQVDEANIDELAPNHNESEEKKIETHNYLKLIMLLKDIGQQVFIDVLKDRLPGANFGNAFQGMRDRLRPCLTNIDYQKLFPDCSVYSGNLEDLELSLLYVILRCLNTIPPHRQGWGSVPVETDRSISANIDRIRIAKNNYVSHFPKCCLPHDTFKKEWKDNRKCLIELGGKQYEEIIDKLLTNAINPVMERDLIDIIKSVQDADRSTRMDIKNLSVELAETKQELRYFRAQINGTRTVHDQMTSESPSTAITLNICGRSIPSVRGLEDRLEELESEHIIVTSIKNGSITFELAISPSACKSAGFFIYVVDDFLKKVFSCSSTRTPNDDVVTVSIAKTERNIRNMVPLSFKKKCATVDVKNALLFLECYKKEIVSEDLLKMLVEYCAITVDDYTFIRKYLSGNKQTRELLAFLLYTKELWLPGFLFIIQQVHGTSTIENLIIKSVNSGRLSAISVGSHTCTMDVDSGWFSMKRRSLLKELKNLLQEYHDPVQLLHELVQNAEDARATIMKITYDKQSYDPGGTLGMYLKSPALCVYNDGVFDNDDWEGITSVCLSHKEDKVDKIGRYGQGFKSVFHLTDYPIVVSGEWMLLIDPFRENNECKRLKLADEGREIVISRMINTFGFTPTCIKDGFYPGTLFWFSLRSKGNILSNSEWSTEKMNKIMQLFEEDASLVLLFLKYLKQIELYEFGRTQSYMSIEINFESDEETRNDLKTLWSNIGKQFTGKTDIVANAEVCITSCNQQKKQSWTVAHYFANPQSLKGRLATLAKDKEIACLPYVGIAYQRDIKTRAEGRIFSFLPLPSTSTTSLPVHVNGNFTLSQNRRHIKLSDGRLDDKFVEWNEILVEELLSNAYISAVQHLINNAKCCEDTKRSKDMVQVVYGCFPKESKYDNIWKKLVDTFYRKVVEMPVFYSNLRNGTWVSKYEAVLFEINAMQLYALEPSQHAKIDSTVKYILLELDKAVVEIYHDMQYLIKHGNLKSITPNEFPALLKKSPDVYEILDQHMKIELLQYLMLGDRRKFSGLKLLPLHSQNFETFLNESSEVFVCKEKDVNLFPGLEHRFVSTKLPKSLHDELTKLAKSSKFQLRTLKKLYIPKLLIDVFKNYCKCTNGIYVENQPKVALDTKWITGVWGMIFRFQEYQSDLRPYEEVPLIPQLRPENTSQVESFHVLKGDYILEKTADQRPLPSAIVAMLTTDGVGVLTGNNVIESSKIIGIDNYIKSASLEGIMELCKCRPALKENVQSYVGLSGNIWSPRHTKAISFGQEEKLVTRLKGILYGYPEDHSVLKEILQNADDAGASEVHFVYDMRHHSTKSIFNSSWEPLQGPALCVFNDACFTSSDLEGIKHLGIGSKSEDKTKTGQFGLGFNSVYHLTDAPMIMSKGKTAALGGMFVVLDPHCYYAPEAKLYGPGMLMPLQELCTDYPDVFNTLLSSNELKRDEGTWFRFPLRTEDMARTSEIMKKTCDIKLLLKNMKTDIQEYLLFLLNVRKISVSVIDLKSKFNVESEVYVTHQDNTHVRFQKQFMEYCDIMTKTPLDINSLKINEFKYIVDLSNHSGVIAKWLIVQTLGFSKPEEIDHRLKKSMMEKQTVSIPRGGVAIKIYSTDTVVGIRPRVFCLLPLEIETGLTCHVNGQFAVDMSRNKLWGSDVENRDIRGIWNSELIRLNISYAYAACIGYLTTYMFKEGRLLINLQKYFKSIPIFSNAKSAFWQDLVFYLFLQMKLRKLCVFPMHRAINSNMEILVDEVGNDQLFWVARHSLNEMPVLFDTLNEQMSCEDAKELRSILVDIGMKISFTPLDIQQSMSDSCRYHHSRNRSIRHESADNYEYNYETCVCIQSISPETAIAFFKSYKSGYKDRFDVERIKSSEQKVHACLRYCLMTTKWKVICGVPLLLNQSGNITRLKMKNDLILSGFYYLLPESADLFVHCFIVNILRRYKEHFQELTLKKFVELLPFSKSPNKYKVDTIMRVEKTEILDTFFQGVWKFIGSTKSLIDELNEWCLLPVIWSGQTYLFPIKCCKYTIDYDSFLNCKELHSILVQMDLPRPDLKSAVLSSLIAKYENRVTTLSCLHTWRSHFDKLITLEGNECLVVLKYLIEDITVSNMDSICKLKDLKLYRTISNETVSLTGSQIVVINSRTTAMIPKDGLDDLFSLLRIDVILDFEEIWATRLFEMLGCNRTNEVNMYLNYIIPNFEQIGEQHRMIHLKFVRDALLSNQHVTSALKWKKLIPVGHGLYQGSDFYDPNNNLFLAMCTQAEFPPSPFCESTWRPFMMIAGMRTNMSEDIFLSLAKRVASQNVNQNIQFIEAFVDFIDRQNVADSFLSKMAGIPFILNIQESKFDTIYRLFAPNANFITYDDSNTHENINLLWTSARVLPKHAMPRHKRTRSQLKIIIEPDFNLVKNHVRNICFELVKSGAHHDEDFLIEVMTSIYDYLDHGSRNVSDLKDVPLVYVLTHKAFVRGNQVVTNLTEEEEIAPFLFKAPIYYGKFFNMFHELGMNEVPTINNYATILKDIHLSVFERVIAPPDLDLIQKALKGLIKSLQNLAQPINNLDVDVLYLLSADNILTPSHELYYDCFEIPRDRLEGIPNLMFVADMRCIGLHFSELHEIFSFLPNTNRPIPVSLILTEQIRFRQTIEFPVALSLQTCLTSDDFIHAVLRIIKNDSRSLKNEVNTKEMENISARLRRLRIKGVSDLETFFLKQNTSMSIPKSKPCVLDESKEIVYINSNHMGFDSWLQSFGVELESIIRVVCYGKFKKRSLLALIYHINARSTNIHDWLTDIEMPYLEEKQIRRIWHPPPGSLVPQALIPYLRKLSKVIAAKEYAVIGNETGYIYVIVTGYDSVSRKYLLNNGNNNDIESSADDLFEIYTSYNCYENENQDELQECFKDILLPTDIVDGYDTVSASRIFYSSRNPNPQVSTGRRWLNQAKYDLKIGFSTFQAVDLDEVKGYNWVCMHCQQAAEKAIKGAIYATDADKFTISHFLCDNIPKGDTTLEDLAQKLECVIIHINRLRYPDRCLPCLPAERYSKDDAEKALELSNEILEHVKSKYFGDHM